MKQLYFALAKKYASRSVNKRAGGKMMGMYEKMLQLKDKINGEEAELFKEFYYGKFFSGDITIGEESETVTLTFHKGTCIDVVEGIPNTGLDIGVSGSKEDWDKFVTHKSLSVATNKGNSNNLKTHGWGVMQEIGITKQGDLTQYNGFDVREKMDQITCPVLVIHGLDDKIATREMAEATISRLTNCKTVVYKPIENYGHFILEENPELVSAYLDEFIQMIETQAS
jgi:hypothetical protein